MQVLGKQASSKKVWFYSTFGGGRGQTKAQSQNDLDVDKLSGVIAKNLKPDPKKTPTQRAADMARLVLAGLALAHRSEVSGKLGNASRVFGDLDAVVNSPMLRPPPDDRLESELSQQERDDRERDRAAQDDERRRLLGLLRDSIVAALAGATAGSPEHQQLTAQQSKVEEDIKLAGVPQADPWRAALVEDSIRAAMAGLQNKIGQNVPPAHQDTVTTKLGGKLTEILDQMVSEAVLKYMESKNATQTDQRDGRAYSVVMGELLANDGKRLHKMFPGLQERIDLETRQFQDTIGELFDRVHADQAELERDMFGGQQMRGLKNIIVADSDPHNGGHRVTILTFEGTDGNDYRVVNKPRDVRVDAKFVGATGQAGLGASLSERATELMRSNEAKRLQKEENIDSLVLLLRGEFAKTGATPPDDQALRKEILSRLADDLADIADDTEKQHVRDLKAQCDAPTAIDPRHTAQAATNVKELPTYTFIDKQDAGNHRYGWVEFIEHGKASDCILDPTKAKEFYKQTGRLAAMAFLCGIEDIHQGNIMVRDGQPVLTDLEIAFSGKNEPPDGFDPARSADDVVKGYLNGKMTNTMIAKGIGQGTQISHNGNAKVTGDRIANRRPESTNEATENTVFLEDPHGTLTCQTDGMPVRFTDDFSEGFDQLVDAFGDPALMNDNRNFINSFAGMDVRFHALATAAQMSTRRTQMESGYTESIDETAQALEDKLRQTDMASRIQASPWLQAAVPSMAEDLANRDVAYYTQTLGTQQVKHNGTTPVAFGPGGTNVLPHDGLEVARRNLDLMARRPDLVKQSGRAVMGKLGREGEWPALATVKQKMLKERTALGGDGGGGGGG